MSDHAPHAAAPEEPKTPMWLPALGAVLFLVVGIWWATSPSEPGAPPSSTGAAMTDGGPG